MVQERPATQRDAEHVESQSSRFWEHGSCGRAAPLWTPPHRTVPRRKILVPTRTSLSLSTESNSDASIGGGCGHSTSLSPRTSVSVPKVKQDRAPLAEDSTPYSVFVCDASMRRHNIAASHRSLAPDFDAGRHVSRLLPPDAPPSGRSVKVMYQRRFRFARPPPQRTVSAGDSEILSPLFSYVPDASDARFPTDAINDEFRQQAFRHPRCCRQSHYPPVSRCSSNSTPFRHHSLSDVPQDSTGREGFCERPSSMFWDTPVCSDEDTSDASSCSMISPSKYRYRDYYPRSDFQTKYPVPESTSPAVVFSRGAMDFVAGVVPDLPRGGYQSESPSRSASRNGEPRIPQALGSFAHTPNTLNLSDHDELYQTSGGCFSAWESRRRWLLKVQAIFLAFFLVAVFTGMFWHRVKVYPIKLTDLRLDTTLYDMGVVAEVLGATSVLSTEPSPALSSPASRLSSTVRPSSSYKARSLGHLLAMDILDQLRVFQYPWLTRSTDSVIPHGAVAQLLTHEGSGKTFWPGNPETLFRLRCICSLQGSGNAGAPHCTPLGWSHAACSGNHEQTPTVPCGVCSDSSSSCKMDPTSLCVAGRYKLLLSRSKAGEHTESVGLPEKGDTVAAIGRPVPLPAAEPAAVDRRSAAGVVATTPDPATEGSARLAMSRETDAKELQQYLQYTVNRLVLKHPALTSLRNLLMGGYIADREPAAGSTPPIRYPERQLDASPRPNLNGTALMEWTSSLESYLKCLTSRYSLEMFSAGTGSPKGMISSGYYLSPIWFHAVVPLARTGATCCFSLKKQTTGADPQEDCVAEPSTLFQSSLGLAPVPATPVQTTGATRLSDGAGSTAADQSDRTWWAAPPVLLEAKQRSRAWLNRALLQIQDVYISKWEWSLGSYVCRNRLLGVLVSSLSKIPLALDRHHPVLLPSPRTGSSETASQAGPRSACSSMRPWFLASTPDRKEAVRCGDGSWIRRYAELLRSTMSGESRGIKLSSAVGAQPKTCPSTGSTALEPADDNRISLSADRAPCTPPAAGAAGDLGLQHPQQHSSKNERSSDMMYLKRVFEVTFGFISPSYPLNKLLTRYLTTPWLYVVLLILWMHSICSPHPLTLVHFPRLMVYAGIEIYRIVVLYGVGNALFSVITDDGHQLVDFSDHIVLYMSIGLIVSTEVAAAERSHAREQRVGLSRALTVDAGGKLGAHHDPPSSLHPAASQASGRADSFRTPLVEGSRRRASQRCPSDRRIKKPRGSPTPGALWAAPNAVPFEQGGSGLAPPPMSGTLEEPADVPQSPSTPSPTGTEPDRGRVLSKRTWVALFNGIWNRPCPLLFVYCYSFIIASCVCYSAFYTAFFFHTRLETGLGVLVGLLGLYVPLWVLIQAGCVSLDQLGILRSPLLTQSASSDTIAPFFSNGHRGSELTLRCSERFA